jgi:hypothetical protein
MICKKDKKNIKRTEKLVEYRYQGSYPKNEKNIFVDYTTNKNKDTNMQKKVADTNNHSSWVNPQRKSRTGTH